MDLNSYATHSPFSEPAGHAGLLADVPADTPSLHRAVTRTIGHYRAGPALSARQLADIDTRWVDRICATALERSPGPLTTERADSDKVGGCCRDHTLLAIAILRQHGIPARSRVGFAAYLTPGFHHDHVVAERWSRQEQRWIRFDPEFGAEHQDVPMHDLPRGAGAPFQTAAQAWLAYRDGHTDLSTYGVMPGHAFLRGPTFVQRYLLSDLAHLMRTELLLWDVWGPGLDEPAGSGGGAAMGLPHPAQVHTELIGATDHLARLIVAADDGDRGAEEDLATLWATSPQVRPGARVRTVSPSGRIGVTDLRARRTEWAPAADPGLAVLP
ncbi:transglutaminase-like domain-containing protein [Pseudactinotalea sp. Z1748]|uniref:transglutaminase-like domain-containing protein n=1 Tax=Pseudactinotalea sp. Z1748 TaxID=3413027 RepID=UPI003C79DAEA